METSLYSIKKHTAFGLLIFSVTQKTSHNSSTATVTHTCPITGIENKRYAHGTCGTVVDAVQHIVNEELILLKEKMFKKLVD